MKAKKVKVRYARLDPHGTEIPRTRLVGKFRAGECVSPYSSAAEEYRLEHQGDKK